MMDIEFKKDRSKFWVKVYEKNDGDINIYITDFLDIEINELHSELVNSSPTGWEYKKFTSLWIPSNRLDDEYYNDFKEWCNSANEHIWLKLNKNIEEYFSGNELNFCIAYDWNFNFDNNRKTAMGEAEYKLKYNHYKDENEYNYYADIFFIGITKIADLISIKPNTLITTIPAIESKQNKLSYKMTEYLSEQLDITQLIFTLHNDKPQTKSLTVVQKVEMWNDIYSDNKFNITHNFSEKDIIIVDDLYQSGTSMWAMAKYLRENGANSVRGLVAVKSMKDSDNT